MEAIIVLYVIGAIITFLGLLEFAPSDNATIEKAIYWPIYLLRFLWRGLKNSVKNFNK
jgi:hypothetical protein